MKDAADLKSNALDLLSRHAASLLVYFRQILARQDQAPPRLIDAIAYSFLAGGKRLRPALVMESCAVCGGQFAAGSERAMARSALAAAAAIELVHTFSLVHDDLPAMDDDDLRRGQPTSHKVYGEATAVLAGDAMLAMAFEVLATDADPAVAPRLVRELAWAAGPAGMIGGQQMDIDSEDRPLKLDDLRHIHRLKTGALLTSSCRLGALSANAPEPLLGAMTSFGRHLGLAFQIVDDILDVTSTPQQLGKATHKDRTRGKNTYPALLGVDASRREAARQLDQALAALEPLGSSGETLRSLARFVVDRKS